MQIDTIIRELQFKSMRSSGPGGQHVNKTSSKVEVLFDVFSSEGLTAAEKERLGTKLSSRLTTQGILSVQCSDSRSQHRNKRVCIERLIEMLREHIKVARPRKKTKPSRSAIEKRLKAKKLRTQKKAGRKPPNIE